MEIYAQRFNRQDNDGPVRPGILRDLINLTEHLLVAEHLDAEIRQGSGGDCFEILFDHGIAIIQPAHAVFPVEKLDRSSLRLPFEIARAGDMSIVAEGAEKPIILTAPSQFNELPDGVAGDRSDAPVCRSFSELELLLRDWFDIHSDYKSAVLQNVQGGGNKLSKIPGTYRDSQTTHLYVQARPRETALRQLRSILKFYRIKLTAGGFQIPRSGLLGGAAWQLVTPDDERFYSVGASGDIEAWRFVLRAFASTEDRSVGEIVRNRTFVLDDGRKWELTTCRCSEITE